MKGKLQCLNGFKLMALLSLSILNLSVTPNIFAQTLTNNSTGDNNGFYYSFWNQGGGGSVSMTLGPAGNYTTAWNGVTNFTAGKGWKTGSPDRVINFSGTFDGGSNGFLAVYGWTRYSLIEYYVVENHGSWVPPGGTSKGTFDSDGGTYNIYETTRTQQPSIDGIKTFEQYWSVRTTKRSSGTVTFANHVAAWKAKGMNLGTSYDYQIMETEGYQSSGSSNITVSEGTKVTDVLSETFIDENTEIELFPNPVTDNLIFTLSGIPSEVSLFSIKGTEVIHVKPENREIKINMREFETGIYLLKVSINGKTITKKVMKQ